MSGAQPATAALEQAALQQIRNGDLAAATELYQQAIRQGGASAAACSNLAALELKAGRVDEAIALLQQALQLAPHNAEAWLNLGTAQHALQQLEPAMESFRRAATLKPGLTKAHANLGHAYLAADQPQHALESYDLALQQQPLYPEVLSGRGVALRQLGRLNESIESLQQALMQRAQAPDLLNNLGLSLQAAGRRKEALGCFEQALALSPEQAELHSNLGLLWMEQGQIQQAAECFRRALQLNPLYPEAHRHLIYCVDGRVEHEPEQQALASLEALEDHPKRYHLHFTIAKYKLDRQDPEAAAWFCEANRIRCEQLAGRWMLPQANDLLNLNRSVLEQGNECSGSADYNADDASADPTLVFIVGLPRSGSTLVETILSQNSNLLDLGEVNHLHRALQHSHAIAAIRTHYLKSAYSHPSYTPAIQAISDKFLYNFAYCQILATAFPSCRILHVYRNPMDNIWSTFTNHFTSSNEWSYNLEQSVAFYHLYREVMAAHEQAMPGRLQHINYDRLTRAPEREVPALIAACGFPWHDAYLHPEQSQRVIHTASVVQARAPISSRSVGRWLHYRELLEPYAKQLEELGYSTAIEPVA